MFKILKNTLLNYIPEKFNIENEVNPERINLINNSKIKKGNIVYLQEREIRVKDNFALQFAIQKSKELNLHLKIIHPKIKFNYKPKQNFIDKQIYQVQNNFIKLNFDFEIINKKPSEILKNIKTAMLITDFNPILSKDYLKNL